MLFNVKGIRISLREGHLVRYENIMCEFYKVIRSYEFSCYDFVNVKLKM